ncbi:MAG TPA: GNAT family N-acetyltransferase [Bryobacteraceae bacterium]
MSLSCIRLLAPSDLPAIMRLKEAAGWNQTAADWERLFALEPEGCFALEHDGALVATATAVTYGAGLAWVGMVLTLPEYRKRGFARALIERVVAFADSRGVAVTGLDATDMGIALYRQFGFEAASLVERWAHPGASVPLAVEPFDSWTSAPHLDLDRAAFGADRTRVLESLAQHGTASIPGLGYAMGRAGSQSAYFGPCVAKSADAAARLLRWFLARYSAQPVFWDIPEPNREAIDLARSSGFRPVRCLTRMFRPADARRVAADASSVFAIAGFEYG